jgi:hypothetical protein
MKKFASGIQSRCAPWRGWGDTLRVHQRRIPADAGLTSAVGSSATGRTCGGNIVAGLILDKVSAVMERQRRNHGRA